MEGGHWHMLGSKTADQKLPEKRDPMCAKDGNDVGSLQFA